MVKKIGVVLIFCFVLSTVLLGKRFKADDSILATVMDIGAAGTLTLRPTTKERMRAEKKRNDIKAFSDITAKLRGHDGGVRREDLDAREEPGADSILIVRITDFRLDRRVREILDSQSAALLALVEKKFAAEHSIRSLLTDEIIRRRKELDDGDVAGWLPLFSTIQIGEPVYAAEGGGRLLGGNVERYVYEPPNKGLKNDLAPGVDMSEKNLSSSLLWQNDLSHADFSSSLLRHAFFTGSHLSGARFAGGNLSRVVFGKTDCRNADFRGTNLENAVFFGDDLTGADFAKARLSGAVFMTVDGKKVRVCAEWKNLFAEQGVVGLENIEWV